MGTYSSVCSLLLFVPLLVSGSLGLIWCLLLLVQGLPPLTEELANLAFTKSATSARASVLVSRLTELDAWVLIADLITGVIGEEHVGRKTALWHVRV